MSSRGRRARGRPPKAPMLSTRPRTNFLRKPKAYQNQTGSNSDPNSRSSTPVSTPGTPTRGRGRGITRESAMRGRQFLHNVLYDDEDASRSSLDPEELPAPFVDMDDAELASDGSFDDSDSDNYSNDSLSTVSSTRKLFFMRRPKTPDLIDDKDIPSLSLPPSSNDLLMPTNHLMDCLSIYEVLRHFRIILRISPFLFEDFCACLLSDEISTLFTEIHITLMKALLREEEANSTTFGPSDLKDSINVSLFFLDSITWPEPIRAYLKCDAKHSDMKEAIEVLENNDYPYVSVTERLKVLKILADLVLATNNIREEILNEGNIQYDDHCRNCHK